VLQVLLIPRDTATDEHTCDATLSQFKHFKHPLSMSKEAFDGARAHWIARGEREIDVFEMSANVLFDRRLTTDVCLAAGIPPLFTSAT
jgi:hypothetical protein